MDQLAYVGSHTHTECMLVDEADTSLFECSFRAAEAPRLHCSGGLHNSLRSQKFPIYLAVDGFFVTRTPPGSSVIPALHLTGVVLPYLVRAPQQRTAQEEGPRTTPSSGNFLCLTLAKINPPKHCCTALEACGHFIFSHSPCVTCPLQGGFKEYCQGPDERSMSCRLRPPARRQPYLHALHSPPDRFEPC